MATEFTTNHKNGRIKIVAENLSALEFARLTSKIFLALNDEQQEEPQRSQVVSQEKLTLTTKEASEILGLSETKVRELAKIGKLKRADSRHFMRSSVIAYAGA